MANLTGRSFGSDNHTGVHPEVLAAIAAANRAIVVTGNRRHFERIPGVTVEDWIRP